MKYLLLIYSNPANWEHPLFLRNPEWFGAVEVHPIMDMSGEEMCNELEDLLRRLAPQVLAALVRHYGNFETAEDAVQEALLAAATQWPDDGVPGNPAGWLITVASRRMTDQLRSERSGRQREETVAARTRPAELVAPPADAEEPRDDTLILLSLCCHPSLTPASQIALTLRAVGGLTTAEIARAFLVPETTMAQRISRAQAAASGARRSHCRRRTRQRTGSASSCTCCT